MTEPLELVEICAGAGGQSLGLHRAGFRHRVAVEQDPDAARTLASNLARLANDPAALNPVVCGDVTDPAVFDPHEHRGVDLLAGGVPCPPFSDADRQLGAADERDLYAWAVGLAAKVRPRALMLENVAGLARPRFAAYRQAVADWLTDLGYLPEWRMLYASGHGVPQSRPRFVLVALRPADRPWFRWPDPSETTIDVGDTLRSLMSEHGWPGADGWADSATGVAPTIVGGSRKHGGPDLGPSRAREAWTRLRIDGRGVADHAPGVDVPTEHTPRLTPAMLARVQGFDAPGYEWTFLGRKTSRCRQIGNAFPPQVAHAVGTAITDALQHRGIPSVAPHEPAVHSPMYRLLRRAEGAAVTETELAAVTDGPVKAALANLARDFTVETCTVNGQPAYRLGVWHANGTLDPSQVSDSRPGTRTA